MNFPGAIANRESAKYAIIGAPLDKSTTFQPGTRFGPEQIRSFSHSFEDYDHHTGLRFTELDVYDHGDIRPSDDVEEYLEYLSGITSDLVNEGKFPVLLGGEHTISLAGFRAVNPDVIISIDAHLDLRDTFDGNKYNHACIMARGKEVADKITVIGARAGSEAEWVQTKNENITVVPVEEVPNWEFDMTDKSVYLTVDIDGADPAFAPGTGTKEPFGLTSRQMQTIVRSIAPHADGMDIVEVNDRDNGEAATLAGKLARESIFGHATKEQE